MHRMNPMTDALSMFNSPLKKATLALALAALFSQAAVANPVGPTVSNGTATFATAGNTLTVTNSPSAVINWQQFNIGQNETTRFVQQSVQSSVLNRIGGQNASQILGTLQSNGRVFLINPNGILFGQGAVIDVAGLVASSLNLSDANFLANRLSFSGGGVGAVTNLGNITTPLGGSVYLIGSDVSNQGLITSPQGQVVLAAGNSVSLIDSAGPELSVTLSASGNRAVNLGTISAAGGRIDMFGALIEQAGTLRADSASLDAAGNIILKATQSTTVSGEISASGNSGGRVQVLGDQVALTPTASIDVSGVGAGGTALIGGDYKGSNAAVQNATQTTIAAGAIIKADALENGHGGRVIVWSNDKTYFDGLISARGGEHGGDGGFVETSGHSLKFTGRVDTRAPMGIWGNWLIDPDVVCFVGVGPVCPTTFGAPPIVSADTVIDATQIQGILSTSDANISATTLIAVLNSFNLVASGITPNGRTLSLTAPHILFDGQIDMTAAGFGTGNANFNITASGTPLTPAALGGPASIGKLVIAPEARIRANSGTMTLRADSEIQVTGPTAPGIQLDMGTGGIIFRAPTLTAVAGPSGAPTLQSDYFGLWANSIGGTVSPSASVIDMDIGPYSATTSLYLGLASSDPLCAAGNLCLNTANSGNISVSGGMWMVSNNNLTVSTAYSFTAPSHVALGARNNLVLNAPLSVMAIGTASYLPLSMYAGNQFINNPGGSISLEPMSPYWGLIAKNSTSVQLNGLTAGSGGTLADPWSVVSWTDGAHSSSQLLITSIVSSLKPLASNGNVVAYFGSESVIDPCQINPTSCAGSVPSHTTPEVIRATDSSQTISQTSTTGVATLTYDARLNVATVSTTPAASTTSSSGPDSAGATTGSTAASATLTVQSAAAATEKPVPGALAAAVIQARVETRASEERKSTVELKQEAREILTEARKTEAEAKKIDTEARKTEAEAKKSEADAKKSESEAKKIDADARRAEAAAGRKAEADAKLADAEVKKAEAEVRDARTPVARAGAEARKAAAEGRKAEAEAKMTDVESRKLTAESKKVEAEAKQSEAEARRAEVAVKRNEADGKKAEAEAQKADSEHKLALAEVREAKTPQQKAAAARKSDDKRIEAIQKKAEAEVKKDAAEAHKAEVEAKKVDAEAKKLDAEAKKVEAEARKAEGESMRAEARAKKSEAEGKKAEVDAVKARESGKAGEEKAAVAKKAEAESQKVEQEKKSGANKAEAEKRDAEAAGKRREAATRKAEAEQMKAAAEQKLAERRERAVRSFAQASVATMAPERLAQVLAMRHEYKTETLKPALSILERNPKAADLPACGSGSRDVCVPARAGTVGRAAQLPAPRIPTVAFLPQIERKVAVIVAINNYADKAIPPLESAIPDGEAIGKLMAEKMGYEVRVIRDGSKSEIVKSLNALAGEVGPNDSVQVYYAGHGYQMPGAAGPGEGYWIPADASVKTPANWISNSDVSKLLANIPARQVMLVSDSCYSGAFTKEQKITAPVAADPAKILAQRTVVVMSSGGEEPVSDEGKEGHSIFAWNLMNAMKNVDRFDPGSRLYEGIRKNVVEEFPQVPQYGASTSAGHVAGGDYLFETRRY